MFVDFEEMSANSRIWIYQSSREFSDEEVGIIKDESKIFLTQWTAHGSGLKSSSKVYYNRFLVICVDEDYSQASGCSIDASVHFVKSLENRISTQFFDRSIIAFLLNEKVIIEDLKDIQGGMTKDSISSGSLTFNNLIQVKSQLDNEWIVPVEGSWLGKYFKTQNA
jgi:hypothetical protein